VEVVEVRVEMEVIVIGTERRITGIGEDIGIVTQDMITHLMETTGLLEITVNTQWDTMVEMQTSLEFESEMEDTVEMVDINKMVQVEPAETRVVLVMLLNLR
jgi:hypothetical protein